MKWSSQKTILFQVGILKLCSENIYQENINTNANKVINNNSQNVDNTPKYKVNQEQKSEINQVKENTKNPIQTVKLGNGVKGWPKIISDLKQEGKFMLYTNLMNAEAAEINDMTVGITFPKGLTAFSKTILEKNENVQELEKRISMEFGKPMKIKYIDNNTKIEKKELMVNYMK